MRPFQLLNGTHTLDEAKATLQLDPSDGEAEQAARMGLENDFSNSVLRELRKQMNQLVPPNATDAQVMSAPSRVTQTSGGVKDALAKWLLKGSELGLEIAADQLSTIGIGFDWGLANQQAADWASRYSGELVAGINRTTQGRLQTAVSDWFQNGDTLPELRRQLAPMFGERRAQMIAQTETTKAAAEGARAAYENSGVVEKWTWATSMDERTCPICSPLEGKTVKMGEEFAPGITSPPVHVNCRCWTRPWIDD